MGLVVGRVENNVRKGNNAGYQMFSEGLFLRIVKAKD